MTTATGGGGDDGGRGRSTYNDEKKATLPQLPSALVINGDGSVVKAGVSQSVAVVYAIPASKRRRRKEENTTSTGRK